MPAGQLVTGEYIVQVRTNADLTTVPANPTVVANSSLSIGSLANAASPGTGGHNRYAMRAGFGTAGTAGFSTNVRLFASGRLPIYVNTGTGGARSTTSFYLARDHPDAGKTHASGTSGTSATLGPGVRTTRVRPTSRSLHHLTPPTRRLLVPSPETAEAWSGVTISGCSVTGMTSANYNGRLTQANIAIPSGYTCDTGGSPRLLVQDQSDDQGIADGHDHLVGQHPR